MILTSKALVIKTKNLTEKKILLKCGLRFLSEWVVLAIGSLDFFFVSYKKLEFGLNLWRILRPHLAILAKILDHILIVRFFLALILVLTTRPLEV